MEELKAERTIIIPRSKLWWQLHNIVKKIPRKATNEDAPDAPNIATELEELWNTRPEPEVLVEEIENIEYHSQGMGCGLEDRQIAEERFDIVFPDENSIEIYYSLIDACEVDKIENHDVDEKLLKHLRDRGIVEIHTAGRATIKLIKKEIVNLILSVHKAIMEQRTCEWEDTSFKSQPILTTLYKYRASCNSQRGLRKQGKFCPYCGKRIV